MLWETFSEIDQLILLQDVLTDEKTSNFKETLIAINFDVNRYTT